MTEDTRLTYQEAADRLQCGKTLLHKLIADGRLPVVAVGGKRWIWSSSIDSLLTASTQVRVVPEPAAPVRPPKAARRKVSYRSGVRRPLNDREVVEKLGISPRRKNSK